MGIGAPLLWFIVKEMILSIHHKFEDIYFRYQEQIERISNYLKISDFAPTRYPGWTECRNAVKNLCEILKNEGKSVFIAIDNFDKLTDDFQDLAIQFLRGSNAQPLIEDLNASGVTVFIILDKRFIKKMKDEDFSYLGEPLILQPLTLDEAKELLGRRLKSWSKFNDISFESIFNIDALDQIIIKAGGIPREIIRLAEVCCEKAYEYKIMPVTIEIVNHIIKQKEEEEEEFYKIFEDKPNLNISFSRLSAFLGTFTKKSEIKKATSVIEALYDGKKENINDITTEKLREYQLADILKTKTGTELRLTLDIKILIKTMEDRQSRSKFFDWIIKTGATKGEPLTYEHRNIIARIDDLSKDIKFNQPKNFLSSAKILLEEIISITNREEFDTNYVLGNLYSTFVEIWRTVHYLSDPTSESSLKEKELRTFIRKENPSTIFFYESLKSAYENIHFGDIPEAHIKYLFSMFQNELPIAFALIQEKKAANLRKRFESVSIKLDREMLGQRLKSILESSQCIFVLNKDKSIEEFLLVMWITPKQHHIFGFITGKTHKNLNESFSIYKFKFTGREFFIPKSILNFLKEKDKVAYSINSTKENINQFFNYNTRFELHFAQPFELASVLLRHALKYKVKTYQICPKGISPTSEIDYELTPLLSSHAILTTFPSKISKLPQETLTSNGDKAPARIAVIDGNNVAYDEKTDDGKPSLVNILKVRDKMIEKDYKVITFISASLKHSIDSKARLAKLIENGEIKEAPAKTYDDKFIIEAAKSHNAYIISNDTFKDFPYDEEFLKGRQMKFKIVQGKVIIED
jgi:hypothetical protein